jgi:hypothetical protein
MLFVFASAASLMLFSSCGGKGATLLLVIAEADTYSGSTVVTVILQEEDGTPVTGASVAVNSESIPHVLFGIYAATLAATINEGDTVSLDAQYGGTSVSGSVTMPDQPNVTAPTTAGGPYNAANDLNVAWGSLSPTPNQVIVQVDESDTVDPDGYSALLSGSSNSHNIPGGTIETGQSDVTVEVVGVNSTTSLGPGVVAGSTLIAANIDSSEPFGTSP